MSEPKPAAIGINAWDERESRKKHKQLMRGIGEFLAELKTAHASVLLHTKEEYRERLAQTFTSHINAVELCQTLVQMSTGGVVLAPEDWLEEPEKQA